MDCAAEYIQMYRMRNLIDKKLCRPNALLLLCFTASNTQSQTPMGPRPLPFSVSSAYWSMLSMAQLSTMVPAKIPFS